MLSVAAARQDTLLHAVAPGDRSLRAVWSPGDRWNAWNRLDVPPPRVEEVYNRWEITDHCIQLCSLQFLRLKQYGKIIENRMKLNRWWIWMVPVLLCKSTKSKLHPSPLLSSRILYRYSVYFEYVLHLVVHSRGYAKRCFFAQTAKTTGLASVGTSCEHPTLSAWLVDWLMKNHSS